MKQHRVGTITLGVLLIIFGLLFLSRIIFPDLTYEIIFKLWPTIFIFLGSEILISNMTQKTDSGLLYDKTAIGLIVLLSFFAMGMAIAEFAISHSDYVLVI